jgi:hypothetical protein
VIRDTTENCKVSSFFAALGKHERMKSKGSLLFAKLCKNVGVFAQPDFSTGCNTTNAKRRTQPQTYEDDAPYPEYLLSGFWYRFGWTVGFCCAYANQFGAHERKGSGWKDSEEARETIGKGSRVVPENLD